MPDFKGSAKIYIQPGTSAYPVRAAFPAASAPDANDGARPYGTTISSATVKAYDSSGTKADDLVDSGSVSVDGDDVLCTLSYPATSGDGVYTLEYRLTLNTGAVLVYDARRVIAGDRSA
ncbi:hypothetical protein [Deferrisoma camini]|uniref:hypothetical protein n=1 Tax=Deferrisoma camini TaxID=1035120 RepID=UPI00046D76CA|nr:hypothetical protein [Deferrisoma camini]